MHVGSVIVASGYGTLRMQEGRDFPKLLEMIWGVPIIVRVANTLRAAGMELNALVLNPHFGPGILEALGEASINSFTSTFQPASFGSGDAILRALPTLRKQGVTDVLVVYADMPLWCPGTVNDLVELHEEKDPTVTMVTVPIHEEASPPELQRYGRVIRDDRRNIVRIVEPAEATPVELAASSVNPSLWVWKLEALATYLPRVQPVTKKGKLGPQERHLPPVIQMVHEAAGTIEDFPLVDPLEALGVNNAAELRRVRDAFPLLFPSNA